MSRRKSKARKTRGLVLMVICFAVLALAASVGIQLWRSPDFKGFSREPLPEPVVNIISGDKASDANTGVEDDKPYDWRDHPVFIIGDSLTQGARKEIEKIVPEASIDAKVSRNMATGVQILREWEDAGLIPDDAIIVVCLANNITDSTLSDAQDVVGMIRSGQSLIMMTGHGRDNMNPVNELIRELPTQYSFIAVADWDKTIAQALGLLGDDGIHINGSMGNGVYADLIVNALEVAQPKP